MNLGIIGNEVSDKDNIKYSLLVDRGKIYLTGNLFQNSFRNFHFIDTIISGKVSGAYIATIDTGGKFESINVIKIQDSSASLKHTYLSNLVLYEKQLWLFLTTERGILFNHYFNDGTYLLGLDKKFNYSSSIKISGQFLLPNLSGLSIDSTGNYYIAGNRKLSDTIGGQTGRSGAFLAKFSPSGQLRWITGEEKSGTYLFGMDVKDDNVCISGWVSNGAVISGDTIRGIAGAGSTHFVACYDLEGKLKWLHHADSVSSVSNASAVMILNDEIIASGSYSGHAKYGDYTLISLGNSDPSLIWYDLNGNVNNAISLHGTGNGPDGAQKLARDPNGNIYVGGTFASELYIAGDTLRQQWSDRDVFIAKYGVPRCRDSATAVLYYPMPSDPVSVFPNPAKQYITVRLTHAFRQNLYFTLYDIQGGKVRSRIISAGSSGFIFDRAALSGGLYLWQLRSTDGPVAAGKLMLE